MRLHCYFFNEIKLQADFPRGGCPKKSHGKTMCFADTRKVQGYKLKSCFQDFPHLPYYFPNTIVLDYSPIDLLEQNMDDRYFKPSKTV